MVYNLGVAVRWRTLCFSEFDRVGNEANIRAVSNIFHGLAKGNALALAGNLNGCRVNVGNSPNHTVLYSPLVNLLV